MRRPPSSCRGSSVSHRFTLGCPGGGRKRCFAFESGGPTGRWPNWWWSNFLIFNARPAHSTPWKFSRRWTNRQGEQQEKTEWHKVIFWEKLADICEQYLKRGDRVYVEGSLEYRQYEDKEGQTRYVTEIRGREMIMLGGRGEGAQVNAPSRSTGPSRSGPEPAKDSFEEFSSGSLTPEDDLPF